jgi:hypothetical protein
LRLRLTEPFQRIFQLLDADAQVGQLRRDYLERHIGRNRRTPRTLRYTRTANGMRAAFLYATLYRRLQRPPTSESAYPQFPPRLDAALHQLDTALQHLWSSAEPAA